MFSPFLFDFNFYNYHNIIVYFNYDENKCMQLRLWHIKILIPKPTKKKTPN